MEMDAVKMWFRRNLNEFILIFGLLFGAGWQGLPYAATASLADQPLFSSSNVPGNLLLLLSVEYPTAVDIANYTNYSSSTTFYGYFDSNKCYTYYYNASDSNAPYFVPYGAADANHNCTSTVKVSYTASYFHFIFAGSTTPVVNSANSTQLWSGNYLNWATTQTIDPFRSALTGGYRSVDTPSLTVLEKAWASGQGGTDDFPDRTLSGSNTVTSLWGSSSSSAASCKPTSTGGASLSMPAATYLGSNLYYCQIFNVVGPTPFPLSSIATRIEGQGNNMLFTNGNGTGVTSGWSQPVTVYQPSAYVGDLLPTIPASGTIDSAIASIQIRVQVCNASIGLESNCNQYGSNYKPEGLIQKYAQTIRVGVFGYVNDGDTFRDGGVLRARMNYVGPTQPNPLTGVSTVNPLAEWSASTGVFVANPDPADASATMSLYGVSISNSGATNYINKFGEAAGSYKILDPVSELYYSGIRYYKNQGNVGAYTSKLNSTMVDGFPVITNWDDPIQYACQKNFILGIGDVNTHNDANLPSSALWGAANEPSVPPEVSADATVNVALATNKVGSLEGLAAPLGSTYWQSGGVNTYYIAGLAYDSHTIDMRPNNFRTSGNLDSNGNKIYTQTVSTYWLDVMEYQQYIYQNPSWLAAKYGGFTVPTGFSPYASSTTSLNSSLWDPQGTTDAGLPGVVTPRLKPANYYNAGDPLSMISGLQQAFSNIVAGAAAGSSQFNTTTLQMSSSNNLSYASSYNPADWTGDVVASLLSFDSSGNATAYQQWSAQSNLDTLASGTGWNTSRLIATASGTNVTAPGVAFRYASLSSTQKSNLASSATYQQYMLNYLRGDRSNEGSSGLKLYRSRSHLLGDIAGSKAVPSGVPASGYSDSTNPGYSSFVSAHSTRARTVFAGGNDGMLHAFDGELTSTSATAGNERFAYVPSGLFAGPNATPATDGLQALGNIAFTHHQYVNSTPVLMDVDFNKVSAATPSTNDWRTILVGGLGKGGKSFYALDVSNAPSVTTETQLAANVLWEFTSSTMGYSFGNPIVVKTKKYGWVVMLTTGYNNSDGIGRLYIVSPKTGTLLETISTGVGSASTPAGLTYATGFVLDYTDYTVDSVYAGDLLGNVWRFDMTPSSGAYSAPLKLATLTASDGSAQPVTTRPLVEVDPSSSRRYVLVGTGRLLDTSDVASSQKQTFYAIADGTSSAFASSGTFPITRSALTANTNLLSGVASSATAGWYYDLTHSTTDSGGNTVTERINVMPTANSGVVAWAGNMPAGGVCAASGSYYAYAVNFATGKSVLTNVAYDSGSGTVTDLNFVNVNGTVRLEAGLDSKSLVNLAGVFGSGVGYAPLNWREIPTPD